MRTCGYRPGALVCRVRGVLPCLLVPPCRCLAAQGRFELCSGRKSGLVDDLANASVKALHHGVRLRMTRRDEAVFNAQLRTESIEHMVASRYLLAVGVLFPAGVAVGELTTIVGQQLDDLDRRGQLEPAQEVDAAFVCHVTVDMQEHPTRGAVDGHEHIAARGFVWHLRQVFDVDVNKAGFVVLEGLLGRDRFSSALGVTSSRRSMPYRLSKRAMPERETSGLMYCRVMYSRSSSGR